MKAYLLLYRGPAAPPNATHEGWPEWFAAAGERLLDIGSPMRNGFVVHADGSTSDERTALNGFCLVTADDREQVVALIESHPLLALGDEYAIEVFEVPFKSTEEEAA